MIIQNVTTAKQCAERYIEKGKENDNPGLALMGLSGTGLWE